MDDPVSPLARAEQLAGLGAVAARAVCAAGHDDELASGLAEHQRALTDALADLVGVVRRDDEGRHDDSRAIPAVPAARADAQTVVRKALNELADLVEASGLGGQFGLTLAAARAARYRYDHRPMRLADEDAVEAGTDPTFAP